MNGTAQFSHSDKAARRVLVTGAGGFVGLNVVELLLHRGHQVVALDNRPFPKSAILQFAELPGDLRVVVADIRDREALTRALSRFGIDTVFHGATITVPATGPGPSSEQVVDVNVVGTMAILEACRLSQVQRLVFASSSAVYGDAVYGHEPVVEDHATRPTSLYGFTKLAGERLLESARRATPLELVIARITAALGPWERLSTSRPVASAPFQLMGRALDGENTILAPGGDRDWTSSRDVAQALVALINSERLRDVVYNIGLGATWSLTELATELAEQFPGFSWRMGDVRTTSLNYADDLLRRRVPLSSRRICEETGTQFQSPAEAIEDYADWTRQNPDAIEEPLVREASKDSAQTLP